MLEYKRDDAERSTEISPLSVKVVGIGGAGANVLDRIALEGMDGAELISMNTDVRGLSTSVANSKIQLGRTLTQGLAAGGDPELGQQAAEEAEAEIRAALQNSGMVFICAGLGGGTGSGAAPYIAKIAREEGAFVVAFVTVPFSFEGKRRLQQASDALRQLEIYANALVTFDNDRMGDLVLPKEGIQQAFTAADQIISQSVRAVTSLVTQPGLIRIGMDDLLTALRNHNSRCLFGFGQAKGENRAQEALARALKSPLLDKGQLLKHAGNAIVQVTGGDSMTLYEVEILMNEVGKHVRDSAQILFGVSADAKLTDSLTVTILSSVQEAQLKPPPEGGEATSDTSPAPAAGTTPPPPAGGGGEAAAEPVAKKSEAPAQDEPERAPVASNRQPASVAAPAPSLQTMAVPVVAKAAAPAPKPPPLDPALMETIVDVAPKPPPTSDPALLETVFSERPPEPEPLEEMEGLDEETETSELDVFVDHEEEEDDSPFVDEGTDEEAVFVNPIAKASGAKDASKTVEELEELDEVDGDAVFVDPFPAGEGEVPAEVEPAAATPEPEPEPEAVEPEAAPEAKSKGGLAKFTSRFRGAKSKDKAEEVTLAPEPELPVSETADLPPRSERPAKVELPKADLASAVLPPKRPPAEAVREIPAPAPAAKLPPKSQPTLPQQDELIPKKPAARGRFEKTEPTIIDGEDLDVPAFLRKKGK